MCCSGLRLLKLTMRDIYRVLYCKERELERLRKEIAVLRTVIPLLEEDESRTKPPAAVGVTVIPFERAARGATQRFPASD